MCDKVVDNYPHALKFVPGNYKTQKMCDKAVNTHPSTIQIVTECYKTQNIRYKVANTYFLHLILFLISIKLKKCVNKFFLKILFLILFSPDKYETQRKCDEAVDDCLAALKFIPDWFVTSKMFEKFHNASLAND